MKKWSYLVIAALLTFSLGGCSLIPQNAANTSEASSAEEQQQPAGDPTNAQEPAQEPVDESFTFKTKEVSGRSGITMQIPVQWKEASDSSGFPGATFSVGDGTAPQIWVVEESSEQVNQDEINLDLYATLALTEFKELFELTETIEIKTTTLSGADARQFEFHWKSSTGDGEGYTILSTFAVAYHEGVQQDVYYEFDAMLRPSKYQADKAIVEQILASVDFGLAAGGTGETRPMEFTVGGQTLSSPTSSATVTFPDYWRNETVETSTSIPRFVSMRQGLVAMQAAEWTMDNVIEMEGYTVDDMASLDSFLQKRLSYLQGFEEVTSFSEVTDISVGGFDAKQYEFTEITEKQQVGKTCEVIVMVNDKIYRFSLLDMNDSYDAQKLVFDQVLDKIRFN
jgi:hypothetical protein